MAGFPLLLLIFFSFSCLLGGGLPAEDSLLTHGGDDGHNNLLALLDSGADLGAEIALRKTEVRLDGALVIEQVGKVAIKVHEGKLSTLDVGDIHIVRGGAEILNLLVGENVQADNVGLGVAVLAGLGGGHLNNLAGAALHDDVATLADLASLLGVGRGGTGIGGTLEVLVVVSH